MFTELHSLARAASLLISVAAEGDALRVTVNAAPTSKSGPAMHPLVLVGTPAELDAGFPEAIQIFEPSALPLLQQAQAAANANGNKAKSATKDDAKPNKTAAAGTSTKRGPGRPPKNASTNAAESKDAPPADCPDVNSEEAAGAPDVDPRQMSLVDAEAAGDQASAESAAEQSAPTDAPADVQPTEPASTDPRDTGLDLPI